MTLVQLKAVCAAYHKKTVDELTQNSVDLFLVAANNARRNAELRHNFEYCRVLANLDIVVPSGGSLGNASVSESSGYGTFAGIREVVAVTRESSAGYQLPVDFTRADMALERERTIIEQDSDCWPVNRYPSDADLLRRGGYGGVVQRGSRLFIYPAPNDSTNTVAVVLQGYGWLADYTAANLQSNTLSIVGTLNPDITSPSYEDLGAAGDITGAEIYGKQVEPGYYLVYFDSAGADGWYIKSVPPSADYWKLTTTNSDDPTGNYTPNGAATGTAVISLIANPTTDFFLLYGASYLQWEIIIELNYFFKSFVPRQEGNLASPEKQRDAAWNAFLEWDSYLVDSNVTKYRG